ncbi:YibE/F family protein [Corynebacterium neomassiliense]|uniref:YibE/F family protein n=1 Tax=Corynebacterium neomassiliense TaxID=2079482 RepID=UPI001031C04D|nr:YibE/F family protein [Corynebacterium neomassiliense]
MHSHSHDTGPWISDPRKIVWTAPRVILASFLFLGAVATVIAVTLQWPHGKAVTSDNFHQTSNLAQQVAEGTVALETSGSCSSAQIGRTFTSAPATEQVPAGTRACDQLIVDITDGPDEGTRTLLASPNADGDADVNIGDKVLLSTTTNQDGTRSYAFQDFQRGTPLWIWLAVTLLAICVVGAWRGVRAIVGLAITLGVIAVFLLPALARGGNPVTLAITACAAVLYLVLFLVHGMNWKTASSLGGTLVAMMLGTGLAALAIDTSELRGLADENNFQILLYLPGVQVTGLLLAGFIIGTLGVLNDVTVAQASTISELQAADPDASRWKLFTTAMRVGRDHLASTVYTLVLSYAGAALPLLVLLSVSGRSLNHILTSDIMATEILRSATGSLALVAAVPLTTAIAAVTTTAKAKVRAGTAG